MPRPPARREQTVTPAGAPVEVRFIGHRADVERLVAALTAAAGPSAGPVSYRPSRYGTGVRAYLTVADPTE